MTETTKDPAQLALQQVFEEVDAKAAMARAGETGMEWLPEWYTRYQGEVEDSLNRLEAGYLKAKTQLENEITALNFRWGRDLRVEIDKQFSEGDGKKKSIRNLFGKIGYRKVPGRISVVIDDMGRAVKQAEEICPQAIKKSLSKTVLKAAYEQDGLELDGTRIETSTEYQKFYVTPEQKLLT